MHRARERVQTGADDGVGPLAYKSGAVTRHSPERVGRSRGKCEREGSETKHCELVNTVPGGLVLQFQ